MRVWRFGIVAVGLVGLVWSGCGGCGGCGGDKPEPAKPQARPKAAPAKPPEVAKRELVTPSRVKTKKGMHSPKAYREGLQTASKDKPLSIVKLPQVTRQEIEADPRLNNPNMPMASKRTLKILEKVQKNNPNLTKPDSFYKAEPNADSK